jgi:hypothetical protein
VDSKLGESFWMIRRAAELSGVHAPSMLLKVKHLFRYMCSRVLEKGPYLVDLGGDVVQG